MPQEPALQALFSKRPQVIKPGLARINAALGHLGPSLRCAPCVLVGGTNGKGSTVGFLWQLLSATGLKTGLFTSPHLWHFAERIQVTGVRTTDAGLVTGLAQLRAALPAAVYEALSFFEVSTLLAWWVFQQAGTACDLLEVGLGGRFDATNAAAPLLSVITSIGLDHQEFLGNTTAQVAREKAGIMRPGRPVLWGGAAAGDAAAVAVLRQCAAEQGALLWEYGREFVQAGGCLQVLLPGLAAGRWQMPPALLAAPDFLRRNLAQAVAAAWWLMHQPELRSQAKDLGESVPSRPPVAAMEDALAAVALSYVGEPSRVVRPPSLWGRFQRVTAAPAGSPPQPLLLDVGHNPHGAQAFVAGLRETGLVGPGRSLPGLVSVLADKDHGGILDLLRPVLQPLVLFSSGSERSWRASDVAPRHRDLPFAADFATAWGMLMALPLPPRAPVPAAPPAPAAAGDAGDRPIVICGSVHATGEVLAALGLDPLDPLDPAHPAADPPATGAGEAAARRSR